MTFDIGDDVCLIIDMECFFVDGQQHCRELGFCSSRGDCGRVAVSPKKPFGRLRDFDRRQAHYLTREIHGLSYAPHKHEQTVPSVRHYVAKLYAEYRTEHRTRVAYKGGTVEKCLLVSMNIPFLNGMPQVRCTTCLGQRTPRDLRLASHSQQTPLCHDGMSRLFSMVLGLFQDTKSGC